MKYTKKQIEDLLEGIYSGRITTGNLPEDLYFAIADYLKAGVYKGFGGDLTEFGGSDLMLLQELRENTYIFSGAKVYQEINAISLVKDDDIKSYSDFKKEALEIYEQYNTNWLETEYKTAIGQAQSAERWNQIEENKETLPYLLYVAVIDPNTSDICLPLDGVCLPVDDPFWETYSPLNHFNCRCTLLQQDKFDAEVTSKALVKDKTEEVEPMMQDLFKMNPGKDRIIFSKDHPYFTVAKGDKDYAKNNFNLPIPPTDEE